MHPDVEEKLRKFIEEQVRLMEEAMGPFALSIKPQFGDDTAEYIKWLNMAYQLKTMLPHLKEEELTPNALARPQNKPKNFKA